MTPHGSLHRSARRLLRVADAGLFRPLWSETILDEMVQAVSRVHPHLTERIERRALTMRTHFDDALVTGWEELTASIILPDKNDKHVVAAAVIGRADVIVTFNIRDFPEERLRSFNLEAQTPDHFLLNQLDLNPRLVMDILREQAQATNNPRITTSVLLNRLSKAQVPDFAKAASQQIWRTL